MGGYGDVQLLREDGLRLDGRKVDEMREVKVEAGILPAADGSAWVQHGLNVAVCAFTDLWKRIHARYRDRTEPLSMLDTTWRHSLLATEFDQVSIAVLEKSAK